MPSFSVNISTLESKIGALEFTLVGNDEYGLDKSIVNIAFWIFSSYLNQGHGVIW